MDGQRDLELAMLSESELLSMLARFETLRNLAREMGAYPEVIRQWTTVIESVENELELRGDDRLYF